ncbi:MAG TPA: YoaK family protein [Oscillatoriaceae cyanobacterium]
MPEPAHIAPSRLGILLGGIAGAVDAIGYVLLTHLFTAHMTGNTVAMGASLGTGHWHEAARRALPIVFFLVGGLLGALIARFAWRAHPRHALAWMLACESGFLLLLMITAALSPPPPAPGRFVLLTALAASAMGVQNVSFRHFGCPSANTTVITGALSDVSEQVIELSIWTAAWARRLTRREVVARSRGEPSQLHATFSAGLWAAYLLGAVLGGGIETRLGWYALIVPLVGSVIATILALRAADTRC